MILQLIIGLLMVQFCRLNDKNYFVWSGVASPSDGDKPQRIYIAEMSNPYTLVPGRVLLSSPDQSWEGNGAVNEGPEVLIKKW